MIGVSFFVYTDMWAIFTVVLAVYFIFTKQYVYASVALTIALWSRQYAVYQLTAICLFLIYKYFPNFKKMVGTCSIVSISFFSLIPLFLLWGGFTPVNQIRYVYIQSHIVYQWSGLWAYLSSLTVYTLPLLIVWLLYHNRSYALLVLSFLMASLYFWSPIQPSLCAVEASFESIGFFDKVLNKYISIKNIVEAIYFISISLQLYYLFHIAKSLKNQPINVFVILSIVMFLLIMPLSYIVWEKYILLLLPIYLLALVKNITTLKI
jgi:hypothetical protein